MPEATCFTCGLYSSPPPSLTPFPHSISQSCHCCLPRASSGHPQVFVYSKLSGRWKRVHTFGPGYVTDGRADGNISQGKTRTLSSSFSHIRSGTTWHCTREHSFAEQNGTTHGNGTSTIAGTACDVVPSKTDSLFDIAKALRCASTRYSREIPYCSHALRQYSSRSHNLSRLSKYFGNAKYYLPVTL